MASAEKLVAPGIRIADRLNRISVSPTMAVLAAAEKMCIRDSGDSARVRRDAAEFHVAVSGFRMRGRNADDDEIAGRACESEGGGNDSAKFCGVGDVAVRGKHGHDGVFVLVA